MGKNSISVALINGIWPLPPVSGACERFAARLVAVNLPYIKDVLGDSAEREEASGL